MNNVLLESGFVSKAAIVGLQDGRKWAATHNFDVSFQEVSDIVNGFVDPSKLRLVGISLHQSVYTFTRMDSAIMVGRDSGTGHGCVIYRCRTCLVIGVYEEGAHPGGCYNMITKLGDYLKDQGF